MTEPTLQCVVLTGMLAIEASRTVRADPISIEKPLEGVISVRFVPIVSMTRLPQRYKPTTIPNPPYASSQIGVSATSLVAELSQIVYTAARGPTALLGFDIFKLFIFLLLLSFFLLFK